MKKKLFTIVTIFVTSICVLSAQNINLGGKGGATITYVTAATTLNGVRDSTLEGIGNAKGLPGFHLGFFGDYFLAEQLTIRGELGYELLRFQSDIETFGNGIIHQTKIGLLLGLKPFKRLTLFGGGEITHRSNSITGRSLIGKLNGTEVKGFYIQGTLGTYFEIKNNIQIGFSTTIPRISSLTRRIKGNLTDKKELIEELRAFQVNITVPILKI